jgi:hypothetical protein
MVAHARYLGPASEKATYLRDACASSREGNSRRTTAQQKVRTARLEVTPVTPSEDAQCLLSDPQHRVCGTCSISIAHHGPTSGAHASPSPSVRSPPPHLAANQPPQSPTPKHVPLQPAPASQHPRTSTSTAKHRFSTRRLRTRNTSS